MHCRCWTASVPAGILLHTGLILSAWLWNAQELQDPGRSSHVQPPLFYCRRNTVLSLRGRCRLFCHACQGINQRASEQSTTLGIPEDPISLHTKMMISVRGDNSLPSHIEPSKGSSRCETQQQSLHANRAINTCPASQTASVLPHCMNCCGGNAAAGSSGLLCANAAGNTSGCCRCSCYHQQTV